MGASANSPKLRPKRKSTTLKHLFDLDSKAGVGDGDGGFACALPRPPSSPESNAEELVEAISLCGSRVFTFTDPSESPSDRDAQRARLLRVLSAVRAARRPLPPGILRPLFALLSANLFRPLPPPPPLLPPPSRIPPRRRRLPRRVPRAAVAAPQHRLRHPVGGGVERGAGRPPRARRARVPVRAGGAVRVGGPAGARPAEGRVPPAVREADGRARVHAAVDARRAAGGAAVRGRGAAGDLGERDRRVRGAAEGGAPGAPAAGAAAAAPPQGDGAYHRQLSYCVMQFVRKEPALADAVARGLLRCWPRTSSHKEVLMIGELEELLDLLDLPLFRKLAPPLCAQIARCSTSCNSQVAERALYVWNNEQFVKMASCLMQEILPPTVDSIEKNLKTHWSKSVRQLTTSVKNMLEEMEPGSTQSASKRSIRENPRSGAKRAKGR
uniref:Uncharacterized protein n=1 Tax=Ananas comosus var. bracteatus TaxID=296719 RepID=A0A6V7NSG3_ANACO|nr:unnamed protein product [Ananas comosus var. bracteatus]